MKNKTKRPLRSRRWLHGPILALGLLKLVLVDGQSQSAGEPGWQSLFDGYTTTGWRGFNQPGFPRQGWVIEGGCLKHLKGGGGGDIITVDSYRNFEFQWEWRVGAGANSGVKYMIVEERKAPIGHEYQMWDDAGRALDKQSTSALYDLVAPKNPPLRPAGEFNQSRILVRGNHVEHWLNGAKVLAYELGSDELRAAIAVSKFKAVPGFGATIKSPILLQDHGGEVWFRQLKLRELPPP